MKMYFSNLLTSSSRTLFALLFSVLVTVSMAQSSAQSLADVTLNVYKEVTCGCCNGWVTHMEENNFAAKINHPKDINAVKEELGILPKWQSCHTAVSAAGYLFEGHVPARYVTQFLNAPPADALGLAAPGMPMSSPGMDMGDHFMAYDIILMMKDGSSKVYANIKSKADQ